MRFKLIFLLHNLRSFSEMRIVRDDSKWTHDNLFHSTVKIFAFLKNKVREVTVSTKGTGSLNLLGFSNW